MEIITIELENKYPLRYLESLVEDMLKVFCGCNCTDCNDCLDNKFIESTLLKAVTYFFYLTALQRTESTEKQEHFTQMFMSVVSKNKEFFEKSFKCILLQKQFLGEEEKISKRDLLIIYYELFYTLYNELLIPGTTVPSKTFFKYKTASKCLYKSKPDTEFLKDTSEPIETSPIEIIG